MNYAPTYYFLSKEAGGRSRPFQSGYAPQFFFLTAGVTGVITIADDMPVQPGSHRTIGAGTITAIGQPD